MFTTIAVPPSPADGAALTDAWGSPAVSVSYDATTGLVRVETTSGPVPTWPGSKGDSAGPWRLVFSGVEEVTP